MKIKNILLAVSLSAIGSIVGISSVQSQTLNLTRAEMSYLTEFEYTLHSSGALAPAASIGTN